MTMRMLACCAVASAICTISAVEMIEGGFKVTEQATAVRLVTVKHGYNSDIMIDRINLTDPTSSSRTVWFSDDIITYHECTNSTAYAVEKCIAATVAKIGGRWTTLASAPSDEGVRITSIAVKGTMPEVNVDLDPSTGNTVTVLGKASLSDSEWKPASKEHHFFKAFVNK